MKLEDYKEIVQKTAIYPNTVSDFGKCYVMLGIFDELQEVAEKIYKRAEQSEINKEKFDVMWYICATCKEFNLNFEKIVKEGLELKEFYPINGSEIFGKLKKYYRDGKAIGEEYLIQFLTNLVNDLFGEMKSKDFNNGLQKNYEKLMKRRETNTLHGDGDNREEIVS